MGYSCFRSRETRRYLLAQELINSKENKPRRYSFWRIAYQNSVRPEIGGSVPDREIGKIFANLVVQAE